MTDFTFPGQLKNRHSIWLKQELMKNNISARSKDIKRDQDLAITVQLPTTCPKPVGVKPPADRVNRTCSERASIIVESLSDSAYKLLKPLYRRSTAVKNLILLRWTLDGRTVFCTLEHYAFSAGPGMLVLKAKLGILPTQGANSLTIPRSDFPGAEPEADPNAVATLDITALRNELRVAVDTYGRRDNLQAAGAPDDPPEVNAPKPPSTREEFKTAMNNLVQILGLDQFYGEAQLTAFAEKAAKNIEGALKDLGLPRSATMALTKTNLFKTFILCDDSGSMAGSLYNKTLTETVKRLVPLATRLNEDGVSLRFINFSDDNKFNEIKENDVEATLRRVSPRGFTNIGAALNTKIVQPLIDSLDMAESLRPLLISIVTDGEATDGDFFEQTIVRCKKALIDKKMLDHRTLGHSAVIFQIHYIGSDPAARAFIDQLDQRIGNFIFCNKKPLDKHILDDNLTDAQRNRLLLEVTASAIDHVLNAEPPNTT